MRALLISAGRAAFDLILPPRCPSCREVTAAPERFCPDCWRSLAFVTAPMCACCGLPFELDAGPEALCGECAAAPRRFTSARAALRYEGAVRPLLMGFKHGDRTHLARLAAAMMQRLLATLPGNARLVPVPLDPARLRKRGYNQAALLAKALSRRTGLALDIDALARVKPTPSTQGMNRQARLRAAQGAFEARRPLPGGTATVLVDDVMTTGATAEACARALNRAGASRVDVIVLARALREGNADSA